MSAETVYTLHIGAPGEVAGYAVHTTHHEALDLLIRACHAAGVAVAERVLCDTTTRARTAVVHVLDCISAPVPHGAFSCDWFALCERPATRYVEHPSLGLTSCCDSVLGGHPPVRPSDIPMGDDDAPLRLV